ncbi:MAG: [FeFe] hydrogenase H-cluster maturation GTPase HydF [Chitinispirillia bacterium]|nr:[FeFe] hydrogenase H-cluster maturation GTPase HydF [Chitinispirillia bacterium]MCL2269378.1 [FeFe] hydrogenase H-cluster maturation GTPase HydF [Chitinispirillia bacterium]
MENTPKSMRMQIGIFGRTNVGKSSFLNMVTSQDVSIVSPQPGTTTDVVEKAMEFRPVGPVVFLDTAGVDDDSQLSADRLRRTAAVFERADVFVVLTEQGRWGEYEAKLCDAALSRQAPLIVVINKTDVCEPTVDFRRQVVNITPYIMECSCAGGGPDGVDWSIRETIVSTFKDTLTRCLAATEPMMQRDLLHDMLPPCGLALLVVPIDAGAPKGRLILPQVQTMRDALDCGCQVMVVRDSEYADALSVLSKRPDIVICDSQAIKHIADTTPPEVRLTTFSVLFARFKGDLETLTQGAAAISRLKAGDRVLISEACTHHAASDDIGRVKIPHMLKERTGLGDSVTIDICGGRDYPQNLSDYSLIIHCGSCMLTRREMMARIREAVNKNVPITNYGMAISYFQGVLDRVIEPFKEIS